ncbi:hypothetical protein BP5796_12413 [Coleophoma crateriformis]|uniref:Uncharacterized protein n=1 Tax=Coleophoma crateriformis TaxID=565419 RepID=A0A3D8Q9F9_9HELO|nr:hypothetical protein BP5796_12413 [Coleophoma crateriformis]
MAIKAATASNTAQLQASYTLLQSGLLTLLLSTLLPSSLSQSLSATSGPQALGSTLILTGLLLRQRNLLDLGDTGVLIVQWGFLGRWITIGSDLGAALFFNSVRGAATLSERGVLMKAAHVIPSIGMALAFAVLALGLWDVGVREEEEGEQRSKAE